MNVIDLPKPASHSLYDEAATRYAEMVKARAVSVYRVGNVRYPGLSDVDLLVVTDRANADNRYFFSALGRLPERYHGLFLHEPFVLPVWSMRVIRHTSHSSRVLLSGRDVLHGYPPAEEPDERWCRMLESYCSYARFKQTAQETQILRGRLTVAVASALRFLLRDGEETLGATGAASYEAQIDALRERFFTYDNLEDGVREAWNLFCGTFEQFDTRLRRRLAIPANADAAAIASDLVRGERACDAFDRDFAFVRAGEIAGYQQELASMNLPFGHLFFIAAHPQTVTAGQAMVPMLNEVVRNLYRVRRRLAEYARV